MEGGLKAVTMMPSILLPDRKANLLPGNASTAGGIMKPEVREALRINDKTQRLAIKNFPRRSKR